MISSTNSNLVNSFLASKSATPIKKQKDNQVKPVEKKQELPKKHIITENVASVLIDLAVTGIFIGTLFYLPEILAKRMKKVKMPGGLKESLLGDEISSIKQFMDIKGNKKILLEKDGVADVTREFIVISPENKVTNRVFTAYEKKPGGRLFLRRMKSLKGPNLQDVGEIANNESKYLEKSFIRKKVDSSEYLCIKRNNWNVTQQYRTIVTPQGQPVMNISETPEKTVFTAFLYDNKKCVGTDKRVCFKDESKENFNILTLAGKDSPKGVKYNPADGPKYDSKLLETVANNF